MSSLSYKFEAMAEQVFEMEQGYVLGFSNERFRQFIVDKTDIDIYQDCDYKDAPSKAKKLRLLIKKEQDAIVGKVFMGLLEIREVAIDRKKEYDDDFIDTYADKANQLREVAMKMIGNAIPFADNEARLNADISTASIVLKDLIAIGEKICINSTYSKSSSENSINDYFRDMLATLGYFEVKDQTRHGVSSSGNDAGEVDLLLTKDGKEVAIIEALKLDCVNSAYIDQHINKSISNYNALGTATFIVAYVSVVNFEDFWSKFVDHIKEFHYSIPVKKEISEMPYPNAVSRIADTILSRDNYDFPVYFMALNIH